MRERNTIFLRIATICLFAIVFIFFFNGYKDEGPSRKKFRKLPGGTEDLVAEDAKPKPPPIDYLKGIKGNKRAQEWAKWWNSCVPKFTLGSLELVGDSELSNDPVDTKLVEESMSGPGRMFYSGSPGGRYEINPYWERLSYKKEAEGWQPYIETPCGALIYEPKAHKARVVLDCTMNEGLDDAIWLGKDSVAVMGYGSVTRQMNVECESVESCATPEIWVIDLASGWLHEYRGELIAHGACKVGGYLPQRLPRFFGKQ
ncbi:MAG: hypothetical protein WC956_02550 [bacterium]